ncbi:hypothetical protein [Mycobacterium sp. OAE908]|uniref:hypothetical protein n=1 Tax=Mycobacterium sp. OAE908 TaxID=2817899 RepID=UPI001AE18089
MSTLRICVAAVALSLAVWGAPVADADCTTAGDFGAGAGCAPPGSGSDNSIESWPPTSVDWPPPLKSDSDSDSGGKTGDAKPAPIVLPTGQKPSPTVTPSTPTPTPTPTPIVIPQH